MIVNGLDGHFSELGCEVDEVFDRRALIFEGEWFRRKRLCIRKYFAFEICVGGHRTFFDWPDRFTGHSVKNVGKPLLTYLCNGLDRASVNGNIDKVWVGGKVVVPDTVVYRLKVPYSLSGLDVECN